MIYVSMILAAVAIATAAWATLMRDQLEVDMTETAAAHAAQVVSAVGSRLFEMESTITTSTGYTTGSPPTSTLLWLKNPATCSTAGIPTVPNDEEGNAVDNSFLPCDFSDVNVFGHSYTISWTTTYPGTVATIQIGSVPFTVNGVRRNDIAGAIALKANKHSMAGIGDGTMDSYIRYAYNRVSGTLTATIDRTGSFASNAFLPKDGSEPMDAAASIRWGNSMAITPNGTNMEISVAAGSTITLQNDMIVNGNVTVNGTVTMTDGVVTGVLVDGVNQALLSQAVYSYYINDSGDTVDKVSCPAGGTPQIFVAAASVPVGEAMAVVTDTGATVSGNISRFRTAADDLGTQWQVWAEVYINGGWQRIASSEGQLRSAVKCT